MTNRGTSNIIGHDGIVQGTDGKSVVVKITSVSACASCHAEGACGVAGKEEKIISIDGIYNVHPGDSVTVIMKQSDGFTALMYGYIIPLIILITALIILSAVRLSELEAGLGSIGILALYYIVLGLFRKKIGNKFTFSLKVR